MELLPFAAVLRGRTQLAWGELKRGAAMVGLILWAGMILLHGRFTGVEVVSWSPF
jgi:uncharacterized membrane protein